MRRSLLALGLCVFVSCAQPQAQLVPDWIVDHADVLTDQEEFALMEVLLTFYERTSVELVGVAVPTTGEVSAAAFTTALFNQWDLGSRETGNGALLLLALDDRVVDIAVGPGIDWLLDRDQLDGIRTAMADRFGSEEYDAGFRIGFEMLMSAAESVPWTVDYTDLSTVVADSTGALGRIVALDATITGFVEEEAVVLGDDGQTARLSLPALVEPLSVDDLVGIHGRVKSLDALRLQVLSITVDYEM